MIYKRNNRKISQQLRINIMDILQFQSLDATTFTNGSCSSSLWTLQLLQPKLAFITPLPYYPTVDKFYYPACPPSYQQWTVTPRSSVCCPCVEVNSVHSPLYQKIIKKKIIKNHKKIVWQFLIICHNERVSQEPLPTSPTTRS